MGFWKRCWWMVLSSFFLGVFACVTINIYFPAEKVESAAGEIVDDIRGRGHQKDSLLRPIWPARWIAVAHAEEATEVSNPTIRALKEKMKARYALLKPFYQKGMLTEGNDGYLSIKNTQGLGLKERRDIQNLVSAENNDRKTLYVEVARALKIDLSQVDKVAAIFAKEWQK